MCEEGNNDVFVLKKRETINFMLMWDTFHCSRVKMEMFTFLT